MKEYTTHTTEESMKTAINGADEVFVSALGLKEIFQVKITKREALLLVANTEGEFQATAYDDGSVYLEALSV